MIELQSAGHAPLAAPTESQKPLQSPNLFAVFAMNRDAHSRLTTVPARYLASNFFRYGPLAICQLLPLSNTSRSSHIAQVSRDLSLEFFAKLHANLDRLGHGDSSDQFVDLVQRQVQGLRFDGIHSPISWHWITSAQIAHNARKPPRMIEQKIKRGFMPPAP
jgi:hypothetical protein